MDLKLIEELIVDENSFSWSPAGEKILIIPPKLLVTWFQIVLKCVTLTQLKHKDSRGLHM